MRPLCTQGIGAELAKSLAGYIEASPALTSMNLLGNDFDVASATMLVRIAKVRVGCKWVDHLNPSPNQRKLELFAAHTVDAISRSWLEQL